MHSFPEKEILKYKWIVCVYCLLFIALISPIVIRGDVIAPYRLSTEILVSNNNVDANIENHKFSDQINSYIPEIQANLNGKKSDWLALWTNQNELGRPIYHISGLSPAYLLSWIIGQFTSDPWYFFSTLTIATCFTAGLLMIFFCRENDLHPLAGLIAGISLSASPAFMYWITFPMFLSVWCWSVGALWGVARLAKKSDLVGWSVLSFSMYSLLMTAYPQLIVFHIYLMAGYGFHLSYVSYKKNPSDFRQFIVSALTAIAVGMFMALPTYIDLWGITMESGRISPDPSFFLMALPRLGSAVENVKFFLLNVVPELFGNPISPDFKFSYNGISFTLPIIFFAFLGVLNESKKIWGWYVAIAICYVLAFAHPIYEFGIRHLGFNLSRSTPLAATILPMMIVAAFGVNKFFLRTENNSESKSIRIALLSILMIVISAIAFAFNQQIAVQWHIATSMFLIIGLLAVQFTKPRPLILFLVVAIELGTISYPLILHQSPKKIAGKSGFIDKVTEGIANGSRFAAASPGISALSPNLNALFNLPSVHSYNSLSSTRYHALINNLGGEMQTYGRWNTSISPNYNSTDFWMSNISLILSPMKLFAENLVDNGEESHVYFYKVASRMGDSLQVMAPSLVVTQDINVGDPRTLPNYKPVKISDKGDQLEFEVRATESQSIFILSQKYHRDWEAQVLGSDDWAFAQPVVINGVFQGVLLPKNAQRVRLEFKPYVRFALYANIFWLLLIGFIFIKQLKMNQQNRVISPSTL